MDYSNLWRQIISMKKSLFDQGYLDEQFNQLEELQDDSSPNFVEEVVALFFKDSSRLLTNIEQALEKYPQDFHRLDSLAHQFKGSGSSIGALRMKNECSMFKAHCNGRNLEGYASRLFLYICISFFCIVLTCFTIPCLTQMPQVTPEDEEGARHSQAEAGDIFSVAEASWSSRARGELMEVTRIAWNAVSREIRVWTISIPLEEYYAPEVLLSYWCFLCCSRVFCKWFLVSVSSDGVGVYTFSLVCYGVSQCFCTLKRNGINVVFFIRGINVFGVFIRYTVFRKIHCLVLLFCSMNAGCR